MSAEYKNHGVRFVYPENWELEENPFEDGAFNVQLSSPEGAFWMLTVSETQTPEQLTRQARKAMMTEYGNLESVETTKMIAGRTLTGYDMDFMCFDLVNTAMVLAFADNNRSYAVFWQADDRQLSGVCEDVFNAITFTLIDRLSND